MARIDELLAQGKTYSFEFFPPRSAEAEKVLEKTLTELEPLSPSFVSVTYGAGGTTRERTHDIVFHILTNTAMTPMAHLSCIGHTRQELLDIISRYRDEGVDNILCLAGDPTPDYTTTTHDLAFASELVELVRSIGQFSTGVAAQPEGHPRSVDLQSDRLRLAGKMQVADFAITQFFFRVEHYLSLVEDMRELGVTKPIIAGIMPVTNVGQIERFASLSGAALPNELVERLRAVEDNPDAVRAIGVDVATELCAKLLDAGAPGLHFYTLNRSTATREIYANLGLDGN